MSDVTGNARRSAGIGTSLSRHRALAVVVGLATFAAVLVASQVVLPTSYTASTSVLVNPLPGNPLAPTQRGDQLTTLPTEARLVTSDAVARQLTADGSPITADKLRSRATVENPPNTAVLKISYTASTPENAAAGADAVANAFLATRTARSRAASDTTLTALKASRASASSQLQAAAKSLASATTGSATYTVLVERVSGLSGQIAALDQQISDVTTGSGEPGVVLSPASAPSSPDGPSLPLLVIVALFIGAAAGVAAATLREIFSGTVMDARDLRDFGVPVLSIVGSGDPASGARAGGIDDRRMVNQLLPNSAEGTIRLLISSLESDAQSLDVTAALAQVFGRDGHQVLVESSVGAGGSTESPMILGRWRDGQWEQSLDATTDYRFNDERDSIEAILIAGPSPLTASGYELARDRDRSLIVVEVGKTRRRDLAKAIKKAEEFHDFGIPTTSLISYHRTNSSGMRDAEGATSPQTQQ